MALRFVLLTVMLMAYSASVDAQQPSTKTDFAHDVVPILKSRCAKCHTNGTYKGGLVFRYAREVC